MIQNNTQEERRELSTKKLVKTPLAVRRSLLLYIVVPYELISVESSVGRRPGARGRPSFSESTMWLSGSFLTILSCATGLVVPLSATRPTTSLQGVTLPRVSDGVPVDLGQVAASSMDDARTLIILGTYPADFNMIEYGQKLRHSLPQLRAKGVVRCLVVVNGETSACAKLEALLGLPTEVELLSDPTGEAGRKFGVSRGWRPDDSKLNPYLKLYLMLFGIGPPNTLPAVLTGYLGNPAGRNAWIQSALQQGQEAGRWPDNVLDVSDGKVKNQFDELPLVGGWGRRYVLSPCTVKN